METGLTLYLLDTDTLIDLSKGRQSVRQQILAWLGSNDALGVCAINVTEFYSGLLPSERVLWGRRFALLRHWDISESAARQAGVWRHDFARRGVQLSVTDTLVAAVSIAQGATIVTDNANGYPLGGVQLLPLRP